MGGRWDARVPRSRNGPDIPSSDELKYHKHMLSRPQLPVLPTRARIAVVIVIMGRLMRKAEPLLETDGS